METEPAPAAVLEELADELQERGLHCTLGPSEPTGEPVLEVTNRRAYLMNERIMYTSGWYWWSWAERIAPITDASRAADLIAKALVAGVR